MSDCKAECECTSPRWGGGVAQQQVPSGLPSASAPSFFLDSGGGGRDPPKGDSAGEPKKIREKISQEKTQNFHKDIPQWRVKHKMDPPPCPDIERQRDTGIGGSVRGMAAHKGSTDTDARCHDTAEAMHNSSNSPFKFLAEKLRCPASTEWTIHNKIEYGKQYQVGKN